VSYDESMSGPDSPITPATPPTEAGTFTWIGLLTAFLVAPLFGLVWAWVAEVAQCYAAPVILFPLLLGVLTGMSIVWLMRVTQMGHRPTIVFAAILASLVAALGQHGLTYMNAYYWHTPAVGGPMAGQDLSLLLREMRPSFGNYMETQAERGRPLPWGLTAQGFWAWLSWAVDAMLVVVGAVAVMIPAMRVPYCNQCRTWYRTVRGGKIDASTGLRLAESLGADEIGAIRSPRYHLSTCQGGCGPTRCELSWEEADGTIDLVQVWLDAAGRHQVAAILDKLDSDRGDG
jgi:hypothetical protein